MIACSVALRKESVDRNNFSRLHYNITVASLSARRAWIEIDEIFFREYCGNVALRKESVDRNDFLNFLQCLVCRSLSARRAWIEIWWVLVA